MTSGRVKSGLGLVEDMAREKKDVLLRGGTRCFKLESVQGRGTAVLVLAKSLALAPFMRL